MVLRAPLDVTRCYFKSLGAVGGQDDQQVGFSSWSSDDPVRRVAFCSHIDRIAQSG